MPSRKKILQGPEKMQSPATAAGHAGSGLDRSRLPLKALPLQKEFESLRRFAERHGLTAEELAMVARALERYPAGEKKEVLESLRSLAEKHRIPHGRLIRLAETMAYEPELERQIESIKEGPPPPMRRIKTGATRRRCSTAQFETVQPVFSGEKPAKKEADKAFGRKAPK